MLATGCIRSGKGGKTIQGVARNYQIGGVIGMKNVIILIPVCLITIVFNSCCPDDIYYRLPEEAGRYYDEHDTIRFFSEETQTYEVFILCYSDESHEIDPSPDRCGQETHYFAKYYEYYKDSCNNEEHFQFNFKTHGTNDFSYHEFYKTEYRADAFRIDYDNLPISTIEILGQTFENTVFMNNPNVDSLIAIRVSYEYGVIQRVFEHATFNLVNDEIK